MELALEGGIGKGSLALFSGGKYLDGLYLIEDQPQTESLLISIELFLRKYSLEITSVDKIYCGTGVGSATGNRVFGAAALGLQTGLKCRLEFQKTFENALSYIAKHLSGYSRVICLGRSGKSFFGQSVNIDGYFGNEIFSEVYQNQMLFKWLDEEFIINSVNTEKIFCLNPIYEFEIYNGCPWFTNLFDVVNDKVPAFYLGTNL